MLKVQRIRVYFHVRPLQALDGFVLVTLLDGTVVYVSENIHKHLGLFQSEHIGFSMYDIIFEEDQEEVKRSIHAAEANAFARLSDKGEVAFVPVVLLCWWIHTCSNVAKTSEANKVVRPSMSKF